MAAPWYKDPKALVEASLRTIEHEIVPLTAKGVSSGSKLFGAAIMSSAAPKALTVATNNERVSPLFHAEVHCIHKFATEDFPDPATRPDARKDCIFLATHEPCSLCLSAITWSGFGEFYYLFTYEDSRDKFGIPYDIDILEQVFRVRAEGETEAQLSARQLYNRKNKFFTARSLNDVVGDIKDPAERARLTAEIDRVKAIYNGLSATYQEGKKANAVSSSVWK